jgi:hypothetical protein
MNYYAHEKISGYRSEEIARAAERRRQLRGAGPGTISERPSLRERFTWLFRLFKRDTELAATSPAPETIAIDPVWTSAATSPYDELDEIDELTPVG